LRTSDLLDHATCTPPLSSESGAYRLRFARTEGDLDAVCKLRYEIFNVELGEGLRESEVTQRDRDEFDAQCQHLMVIDKRSDSIVGTYRMQLPEVARQHAGLYSDAEFDLSGLPARVLEQSVELGRACVAREHRSRRVLFLLWRGLLSYIEFNDKRYLFGCSSLTSQDHGEGQAMYAHLQREGHIHPTIHVAPKPGFECDDVAVVGEARVKVPQLFAMYLRYGAHLLGRPAIDRVFGTIDFLTLLDKQQVPANVLNNFRA
jgi:putative hemolysin